MFFYFRKAESNWKKTTPSTLISKHRLLQHQQQQQQQHHHFVQLLDLRLQFAISLGPIPIKQLQRKFMLQKKLRILIAKRVQQGFKQPIKMLEFQR